MKHLTINEVVKMVHPTSVAVNNPKIKGVPTRGDTLVSSFEVEYDEADGILLWIDIIK